MSKQPWRHVHVDDEAWDYRVGGGLVIMRDPTGFIYKALLSEVKAVRHDLIERGRQKGTEEGMILPSEIAAYVKQLKTGA